jgi:hypothetical protein
MSVVWLQAQLHPINPVLTCLRTPCTEQLVDKHQPFHRHRVNLDQCSGAGDRIFDLEPTPTTFSDIVGSRNRYTVGVNRYDQQYA